MNNVPVIFPLAKSHPRRSPEPRRKLIVNKSLTSNQETQPSVYQLQPLHQRLMSPSVIVKRLDDREKNWETFYVLKDRWNGICPSLNLPV